MWQYWRGTANRLIRINWMDIWGVQTIHRFGHQSGPGKRSGGLSTAKLHDFPARAFLDGSENQKHTKTNSETGPGIQNTGKDIQNQCKFLKILDLYVFSDIPMFVHVFPTSPLHLCMLFTYMFCIVLIFPRFSDFPIFPKY